MAKCKNNKCGSCCFECKDYGQCGVPNCKDDDFNYPYEDCFFFIDPNNKRVAIIDNPFGDDDDWK